MRAEAGASTRVDPVQAQARVEAAQASQLDLEIKLDLPATNAPAPDSTIGQADGEKPEDTAKKEDLKRAIYRLLEM